MSRFAVAAVVLGAVATGFSFAAVAQDAAETAPAAAAPAAEATIDLKPKFEVGQEARFTLESVQNTVQTMAGQEQKQSVTQHMTLLRKVTAVDESGVSIELIIESLKVKVDSPMMALEFDSSKPAEEDGANPYVEQMRSMVNAPIQAKLDANGMVQEVTMPEGVEAAGALDKEKFAAQFEPLLWVKSDPSTATVGEEWNRTSTQTMELGEMKSDMHFKLAEVKDSIAMIQTSANVTLAGDMAEIKQSKSEGSYRWDTAAGILDEYETTQQMELSIAQMGVDVKLDSRTSLKRSK